jgi:hypothetical protein
MWPLAVRLLGARATSIECFWRQKALVAAPTGTVDVQSDHSRLFFDKLVVEGRVPCNFEVVNWKRVLLD